MTRLKRTFVVWGLAILVVWLCIVCIRSELHACNTDKCQGGTPTTNCPTPYVNDSCSNHFQSGCKGFQLWNAKTYNAGGDCVVGGWPWNYCTEPGTCAEKWECNLNAMGTKCEETLFIQRDWGDDGCTQH